MSAVLVGMVVGGVAAAACQPTPQAAQSGQARAGTSARSVSAGDERSPQDRYDLGPDERRGGHTLERHIGRSDDELRERLRRERRVTAASTYTDRATAERVVARALSQNRKRVQAWLERNGNRPNLVLDYRGLAGESIGRSIKRGSRTAVDCSDALVVLRWDRGRSYYVLTTYPEARR